MICPRCKEKNSEKAKVCGNCGLKLKTICPRCKAPNKLGQPKCANCGLVLIRFCPKCKAANFPHAQNCRKCGFEIRKPVLKKKPPAAKPEAPLKTEPEKRVKTAPKLEEIKPEVTEIPPAEPVQERVPEIKPEIKPEPEVIQKKVQEIQPEITTEPEQEEIKPKITEAPPTKPVQERAPEVKLEQIEIPPPPQEEVAEIKKAPSTPPPEEPAVKQPAEPQKGDYIKDGFKKELTRNEATMFLQELITKSDTGYVVNLSAPDGIGKTTIISALTQNIKEQQPIWLVGQCDPNKRNVSYAFFRDMFSTLFGIPLLTTNVDEAKKSINKIFETNLGIKDESVLNAAYKVFLNEHVKINENIEVNRKEIQSSIAKILSVIGGQASLAMIVEDFEYIDKASFDCIKYLIKNGFLDNKNFIIINHNGSVDLTKLFAEEILIKKFFMLIIKPLITDDLNMIALSLVNNQDILPENLKNKIFRQSRSIPLYLEQALWYLFQTKAIYSEENILKFDNKYQDIDFNPDFTGLFKQRLKMLEKVSPDVEKIVFNAALLGFKFAPALIQSVTGIDDQKMQENLQLLINNGIFIVINQQTLAFKHIKLWKIIYDMAFESENIKELNTNLFNVLQNFSCINNVLVARHTDNLMNIEASFNFYQRAAQEAFSMGDNLAYTDNQIKVYEMIPSINIPAEEKIDAKLTISEQLAKTNYELNPSVAIKYLNELIDFYEQEEDMVKVIELIGYLSRSLELTGDFVGVLDCAEKAIILTDEDASSVEVMLLDYSRLEATFNLGRLEETIVIAKDDILPVLERAISKNEFLPGLTVEDYKKIEYETKLILAKAYTFQGNIQAEELLNKIAARAEKEGQQEIEARAILGQALFKAIQGNINSCEDIIQKFREKGFSFNQSDEVKLQWLIISILTNMMTGNYEQARGICYSALSIAKESRNYNIFALIKLLSGFFYQHFQYYKDATDIYEEIAHYCSEHKMATGAIYSWFFAAEAELQTGNPDKAREIAEKALDVSQKPNINNFISIILLSKLIAEIKIISGDLEGAQINLESALNYAEDNKLSCLLIELYITLGKIYQEKVSFEEENKEYLCSCAYRSYLKSLNIAEKLDNAYMINRAEKTLVNLDTFCKLSGIELDKN